MKANITVEDFDGFNGSNIQCVYNIDNHVPSPVYQQCERCIMVNGTITPLCSSCGYTVGDMRLCNDCYKEREQNREAKWLTQPQ